MRGSSQFSFWISIALVKICFSCLFSGPRKNTFELVGTVLKFDTSSAYEPTIAFLPHLIELNWIRYGRNATHEAGMSYSDRLHHRKRYLPVVGEVIWRRCSDHRDNNCSPFLIKKSLPGLKNRISVRKDPFFDGDLLHVVSSVVKKRQEMFCGCSRFKFGVTVIYGRTVSLIRSFKLRFVSSMHCRLQRFRYVESCRWGF